MSSLAILAITRRGASLARRLAADIPGSEVWLPEKMRATDGCRYYREPLAVKLGELFRQRERLVCVMATGIVVRLLAPHLQGKQVDPAVVVADEAGRFAVSLLSGHLGGANQLAEEVALLLGGTAVITTATDVNSLPAWDEVARRHGLLVEPVDHIKHLNRMLLEGERIALVDPGERIAEAYADTPGVTVCRSGAEAIELTPVGIVWVTHDQLPGLEGRSDWLALRPRDLVVGIGCNRDTSAGEIEAEVAATLAEAGLSAASVACLASIEAKQDEAGLLEYAAARGLTIEFHSGDELNRVDVPGAPSPYVLAAVGAKGVCEPAAVLTAGGGPLLVTKQKRGNVTVAVAARPGA